MNKNIDVNDTNTLSCPHCGFTLFGDQPSIEMLCENCINKLKALFPDGWICSDCGEKHSDEFPANFPTKEILCKNCI